MIETHDTPQQEESISRAFKGLWIPREIWLNTELDLFEKALWAEIDSLDDPEIGCIASNQYFCKFFNVQERKLQLGLSKLKALGFISYESFDGRRRTLKSCPKTIYEKFDTPGVSKNTPLTCEKTHPYNKGDNKEKKTVVSPPPVGRGEHTPNLEKEGVGGKKVNISIDDVFRAAVKANKNWTTEEIQQSWKILSDYRGFIRDPILFIEGTIKKIRNQQRAESWKKTQPQPKNLQKPKNLESENCKETSLESATQELHSLASICLNLQEQKSPNG